MTVCLSSTGSNRKNTLPSCLGSGFQFDVSLQALAVRVVGKAAKSSAERRAGRLRSPLRNSNGVSSDMFATCFDRCSLFDSVLYECCLTGA